MVKQKYTKMLKSLILLNKVCGYAKIFGNTIIANDAFVEFNRDYFVFKNNWSNQKYVTYTHSNKLYTVYGDSYTGENLIKEAYEENQLNGDCYKNMVESVERLYAIFDQQN